MDDLPTPAMQEEADYWFTRQRLPPARPPQVTVVIPTFCAATTLLRAARSALDQTLRDIEVIIVDDASTDSSWQLISHLIEADPRVCAIRHKRNCGKPIAMNRAIALAQGRWLAVLDADDWYHSERLAVLVDLGEQWQVDLVADNQFFYDAPANSVVGTAWPAENSAWEMSFDDFLTGSNAYETFNLGMLKPVLRLDFMRRNGLAYEAQARHGQDFFHMLQFYLLGGRAMVSDTPFYYYTQPFGMISRRWSHTGRKRYDFQCAYDINERYLREAEPSLPPRILRQLRMRNRRLKLLEFYYRAKESIVRGDWLTALSLLTRHPAMLGYLFRRVYGRLRNRPAFFTNIHRIGARSRQRLAKGGLDAGHHRR